MSTESRRTSGPQGLAAAKLYSSASGYQAMQTWYASTLAHSDPANTSLTIPTRFGDTHLLAAGPKDAPPVVLLHGTEGTALSWRFQMGPLSTNLRLYALDVIGSAGKSAPTRLPYAGNDYAWWLGDMLDGLDVERASFVGISNGSWLIVKLAELAPERITSAVLLSANGLVPVRFPYHLTRWLDLEYFGRVQAALSRRLVTRPLVRTAVRLTAPSGVQIDSGEIEWLYLLAKYYRFRFPPPPLTDQQLSRLTAGTLLLMGAGDPFYWPHAAVARARALLPNLHGAEVVSGVGHNMISENPELINRRLAEFLLASRHRSLGSSELPATEASRS
jgi:pimeloyl-ACP methyl ester carboxylesterase